MGGGSPSTTQTTQTQDPWAGQQPYLSNLFYNAQQNFQGQGPQFFPAQQTAAPNAIQQAGQQQALDFAGGGAQNLANMAQGGIQYGLGAAMDPQNNPFFRSSVEGAIRPAVQAFSDPGGVLSQIRSEFGGGGENYGSTRRDIAGGIAGSRFGQSIADTVGQMGSRAYDTGQQTFRSTMGQIPMAIAAGAMPSQITSGVGGEIQGQQQQVINDAIARWNFEQNAPMQQLQNFANLIRGNVGGTTQATTQAPTANPLAQGAGTALSVYSLLKLLALV